MVYKFKNIKTSETKEIMMTLKQRDEFLKENSEWKIVIDSAPPVSFKGGGWMTKPGNAGRKLCYTN